ncbi:MAG: hypothetical protein EXS63_08620 [Candidatus Omnitrophica bacterium]|nr:hypothetical protein [Candidatus Omnitrophota bacterium]
MLSERSYYFEIEESDGRLELKKNILIMDDRGIFAKPKLEKGARYRFFVNRVKFSEKNQPIFLQKAESLALQSKTDLIKVKWEDGIDREKRKSWQAIIFGKISAAADTPRNRWIRELIGNLNHTLVMAECPVRKRSGSIKNREK